MYKCVCVCVWERGEYILYRYTVQPMAGRSSVRVKVLESVRGLVGVEKNTFLNHPDVIVTNDDSHGLFFPLTILSANLAHSHSLCVCVPIYVSVAHCSECRPR